MIKKLAVNITLLAVSLALVFAGLEIFLRTAKIQPGLGSLKGLMMRDPKVGFRYRPGFQGHEIEKEYDTTVRINAQGFRSDRDYAHAKKNGQTRVAVLGDSFVYGVGVNNGETFPDFLQEELGPDFEVLNMGVGGYGTINEAALLKHYALDYDPDVVLLAVYLGNDLTDNVNRILDAPELERTEPEYPLLRRLKDGFAESSYAYRWLRQSFYAILRGLELETLPRFSLKKMNFLKKRMDYDYMLEKHYTPGVQKGFDLAREALTDMRKTCERRGIRLAVLILPLKDQVIDANWERWSEKHAEYDRQKPQRVIKTVLADAGVTAWLDLLPILRQAPDRGQFYFKKDIHCTVRGNRFLAGVAADFVRSIHD